MVFILLFEEYCFRIKVLICIEGFRVYNRLYFFKRATQSNSSALIGIFWLNIPNIILAVFHGNFLFNKVLHLDLIKSL